MSDFITAATDVLDYVNRPSSEMLTQAKRELNNSVLWFQRKHAYKMVERIIKVTYPANTLFINLSAACEGKVRNLMNVQKISSLDVNTGIPLEIVSYNEVLRDRRAYQGRWESQLAEETIDPPIDYHGDTVTDQSRYQLFLVGENNVGLYPTPQSEVYLMINLNIWLPVLVANADTNFFFTYAYDLLTALAVNKMSLYLKEDRRVPITKDDFLEAYKALMEWDASIRPPPK